MAVSAGIGGGFGAAGGDPLLRQRGGTAQEPLPPGYEYDPVQGGYRRTPTSAGTRVGQALSALQSQVPGMFGPSTLNMSGASGPGVNMDLPRASGGSAPDPAQVSAPNTDAAQANAFAKAKDQVGQTARASLTALRGELAGRGMLGSGAEERGVRDVAEKGMGELGDVSRSQAVEKAEQAADFAKTGYQGAITQRGQNIQNTQAQADLAERAAAEKYRGLIEQRGQNIQVNQQIRQSLAGLVGSFQGLY